MTKTLLYRLFGAGKFPEHLATQLKGEGVILMDEGLKGSVTYRNFRAPGRYSKWRRQWYTAALALTQFRLLALRHSRTIINVPLTDERINSMQFSVEEGDTFLVGFDASLFNNDWSGRIECRFRTPQARAFLDGLRERVA